MATEERIIRKFHFKSPEACDRRWIEWFREEFNRQLYNIEIEPSPDAPFRLEATTRILPDLAIARTIRSPMRTSHHGNTNDDVCIVAPFDGRLGIHFDGDLFDLKAGSGWMVRNDTPGVVDMPLGVNLLSIRLKRQLIEPLMKGLGRSTEPRDPHAMRLLLAYVRVIENEDANVSPETSRLVTAHVHDLAALAFGSPRNAVADAQGSVRAARFEAIKVDILARIGDSTLSVGQIAQRHRTSTRYVQMLFERAGLTLSEFVLEQRLLLAHRLLTNPLHVARKISDIAHMAGFGDVSYFHRAFRRRFCATPADVRSCASSST
ncbi:MAG TPA: helix-turn-helix transcriptional regulator [Hyphomicrobium sp.]|nr:helix-turn-helix transcriptional regulator [Hyphomicrobium sp.]